MSFTISKLYRASFRGIEFNFTTEEVEGGRKTSVHEFPNSNKRYVEDLGLFQKNFRINAIFGGDNYLRTRDQLLQALDSPGPGRLSSPFFGSFDAVLTQPYTLVDDENIGISSIQMTFSRFDEIPAPTISSNNLTIFSEIEEEIINLARIDLIEMWDVSANFRRNAESAQNLLRSASAAFEQAIISTTSDADNLTTFNTTLDEFEEDISSEYQNSEFIADNIETLFNQLEVTVSSFEDRLAIMATFFNFGDDFDEIPVNDSQTQQASDNQESLIRIIKSISLAKAYKIATRIEYDTDQQLISLKQQLDNQYNDVYELTIGDNVLNVEISNIQSQFNIFYKNSLLNISKVITIETNAQPLTTLVYSLYGNMDNLEIIFELNEFFNPSIVEGEVMVLGQ